MNSTDARQRIDDNLHAIQAILCSFGRDLEIPTGNAEFRAEPSSYLRIRPRRIFDAAQLSSYANVTGAYLIFEELVDPRQILAAPLTNQTICGFVDVEQDEPLLMAFWAARLTSHYNEQFQLLVGSHGYPCGAGLSSPHLFAFGHEFPTVLILRSSSPFLGRVNRYAGLLTTGRADAVSYRSNQFAEHPHALGTSVAPVPQVESEVMELEASLEALNEMERVSVAEEARAEAELDDSRITYTLARGE
jgi:hypothetical protein